MNDLPDASGTSRVPAPERLPTVGHRLELTAEDGRPRTTIRRKDGTLELHADGTTVVLEPVAARAIGNLASGHLVVRPTAGRQQRRSRRAASPGPAQRGMNASASRRRAGWGAVLRRRAGPWQRPAGFLAAIQGCPAQSPPFLHGAVGAQVENEDVLPAPLCWHSLRRSA